MMKKITFLLVLFISVNIFSQENNRGDRAGTLFYPTIDKTKEVYSISVDLFELRNTKYIEAELLDDNEVKQASKLVELIFKNKKYYIIEEEGEKKEVSLFDINFQLKNPDDNLSYPKLKIKILNENYQVMDYSQKIFY